MILPNYNQPPCFWLPFLFGSISCHIIPYCSASLQFDGFIDLDSYDTIAMKLKGDGRCYISTVSTFSYLYQNIVLQNSEALYQARIDLSTFAADLHRKLGKFTWTTGR